MDFKRTSHFIGADIGGTHISVAKIHPDLCEVVTHTKQTIEVDSSASSNVIIAQWISAIKSIMQNIEREDVKIGIAMPGPFDYENGICLIKDVNKYESLYGLNIRNLLADGLAILPNHIFFRNDAEAFLHGEICASPASSNKAIGFTLGTGIGSASSLNGITKDLARYQQPMLGGIAEDYLTSIWILKRFKEISGKNFSNVKQLIQEADPLFVKQVFEEFGDNLGAFLKVCIVDENASEIILGGNIARCWDLFIPNVLRQIENLNVNIKQTKLWDNAALLGAAVSLIQNPNVELILNSTQV